ncbi:MAG TPA: hypothetical protein PLV42_08640 [bacterium]|nr:hypothetical protein [bacterium]
MSTRFYRVMVVIVGALLALFSVTGCNDFGATDYGVIHEGDEQNNDIDAVDFDHDEDYAPVYGVLDEEFDDSSVTDEDVPDEDIICPFDENFLDRMEGVDTYFAFRAIGVINDGASTARPTAAFMYKLAPVLPNHPDFKLSQPLVYYSAGVDDGISFYALGDPGTKYYGSAVTTSISKEFLETNRDALLEDPTVEGVTSLQVVTIEEIDATTIKQCTIAVNDIDENGAARGKMSICVAGNVDFSIGENMNMAVNAPLIEDVDKMLEFFEETDPAKLCACFDVNSSAEVPCPGTETPDDDTLLSDSENTDDLLPDDE